MRLILGGYEIENHSFLRFLDVTTEDGALMCVSDNTDCCTEDNANWFRPDSTTALTMTSSPYFVTRSSTDSQRNVALNRVDGGATDDDDGLYHCDIIGTDGSTQMLYVWLDRGSEGKH